MRFQGPGAWSDAGEVSGVRAVDHVIGRLAAGGIVDLPDGIRQRLAGGKRAIGLDREGDGDGEAEIGQRRGRRRSPRRYSSR